MGDVVAVAFGAAALAGILLLGLGAVRRRRILLAVGAGILLGLIGLWVLGPPGGLAGLMPLVFLKGGPT